MKRRNVLLGSAAVLAAPAIGKFSLPARAAGAPDPNRLNQDLTPLGGERAASASGLVPAWTGGVTQGPAGWTPDMPLPDLFGDEKLLYSVTAANMDQYANMLSDGQMQLLKRFGSQGFRLDVYPSHRTAAAPQYVYDNTFKNVTRAQPVSDGIVWGFTGAVGGVPFPILSNDPALAGAQAIWNHELRWQGFCNYQIFSEWVVGNNARVVTAANKYWIRSEYFNPEVTPETLPGFYANYYIEYTAPANLVGGKFLANYSLTPKSHPNTAYEYLVGEGRVREAPAAQYDVPASQEDGFIDYDESGGFTGALNRYNWNLVGKKEMIVPYNQHALFTSSPEDVMGLSFVNPDLVRHEVHRCWVVEATLAPGKRMTEPFRRFYVDEDTWVIVMCDAYDDQKNYWKQQYYFVGCFPQVPGTLANSFVAYNLQEGGYTFNGAFYGTPAPLGSPPWNFDETPANMYQPQSLANSGGL